MAFAKKYNDSSSIFVQTAVYFAYTVNLNWLHKTFGITN